MQAHAENGKKCPGVPMWFIVAVGIAAAATLTFMALQAPELSGGFDFGAYGPEQP